MPSSKSNLTVEVEACSDCHLHAWCSRHDESKYIEHFDRLKSRIQAMVPGASVNRNTVPVHYRRMGNKSSIGENKYFDEKREEFVLYPKFGAFEVYVDGMLIFSKLKSNLWPKADKVAKIVELIHHEKENGGNLQKYSLQYRLQNDNDEDFVDTYKSAIVKHLNPIRRPQSNPYNRNPSSYESPASRKFVSRKMNTGQGNRPKRNIIASSSMTKSRNIDYDAQVSGPGTDNSNGRPLSKRNKKRGLDKLYEDEGLLFVNESDKFESYKIDDFQIGNINNKLVSPPDIKKKNRLAFNKNVIPFEPIEGSPPTDVKNIVHIRKASNKILPKSTEDDKVKTVQKQKKREEQQKMENSPTDDFGQVKHHEVISSPGQSYKRRPLSKRSVKKNQTEENEKPTAEVKVSNVEKQSQKHEQKIAKQKEDKIDDEYDNQFIIEEKDNQSNVVEHTNVQPAKKQEIKEKKDDRNHEIISKKHETQKSKNKDEEYDAEFYQEEIIGEQSQPKVEHYHKKGQVDTEKIIKQNIEKTNNEVIEEISNKQKDEQKKKRKKELQKKLKEKQMQETQQKQKEKLKHQEQETRKLKQESERRQKERLEKERLEKERLQKQRLEKQRLQNQRLEKERLEKEKLEEDRLEKERLEKQRLQNQRLKKEKLEKERIQKQRLEQERLEKERLQKQKLEMEKLEKQRLEKQRLEKQKLEAETIEKQKLEKQILENEELENERLQKEKFENEQLQNERIENQRLSKERFQNERLEQERLENERLQKERHEKQKLEGETLEKERLQKQRLEQERLQNEKLEKEKLESQKLQADRSKEEKLQQIIPKEQIDQKEKPSIQQKPKKQKDTEQNLNEEKAQNTTQQQSHKKQKQKQEQVSEIIWIAERINQSYELRTLKNQKQEQHSNPVVVEKIDQTHTVPEENSKGEIEQNKLELQSRKENIQESHSERQKQPQKLIQQVQQVKKEQQNNDQVEKVQKASVGQHKVPQKNGNKQEQTELQQMKWIAKYKNNRFDLQQFDNNYRKKEAEQPKQCQTPKDGNRQTELETRQIGNEPKQMKAKTNDIEETKEIPKENNIIDENKHKQEEHKQEEHEQEEHKQEEHKQKEHSKKEQALLAHPPQVPAEYTEKSIKQESAEQKDHKDQAVQQPKHTPEQNNVIENVEWNADYKDNSFSLALVGEQAGQEQNHQKSKEHSEKQQNHAAIDNKIESANKHEGQQPKQHQIGQLQHQQKPQQKENQHNKQQIYPPLEDSAPIETQEQGPHEETTPNGEHDATEKPEISPPDHVEVEIEIERTEAKGEAAQSTVWWVAEHKDNEYLLQTCVE